MPTESLDQHLKALHERDDKPWIVNFFSGVGAWFSALFMLIFLAIGGAFNNTFACATAGAMFFAGAILLSRGSTHVFANQLALGMLLAGNAMLLAAAAMQVDVERYFFGLMTMVQIVLAIITCIFFKGVTGRFLSLVAVPALAASWLVITEQPHGLHGVIAVLAGATAVLWTRQHRPEGLHVVAWAAMLSLPCVILLVEMLHGIVWWDMPKTPLWPSSLVMGVMLIGLVAQHHGRVACSRPWFIGFAVMVIIIAALGAAGVLVAMTLLYMARREDEPGLTVIGHLFLVGFLVLFYYALNISLAEKSLLVTGSGVVLLLFRQAVAKYAIHPEEVSS